MRERNFAELLLLGFFALIKLKFFQYKLEFQIRKKTVENTKATHIQYCVVCLFESGENEEDLGKRESALLLFSPTQLLLPLTYHVLRVIIHLLEATRERTVFLNKISKIRRRTIKCSYCLADRAVEILKCILF